MRRSNSQSSTEQQLTFDQAKDLVKNYVFISTDDLYACQNPKKALEQLQHALKEKAEIVTEKKASNQGAGDAAAQRLVEAEEGQADKQHTKLGATIAQLQQKIEKSEKSNELHDWLVRINAL